jgi:hypothetical protein
VIGTSFGATIAARRLAATVEWIESDGIQVVERIEELDDEIEPPSPVRALRGDAAERDVVFAKMSSDSKTPRLDLR